MFFSPLKFKLLVSEVIHFLNLSTDAIGYIESREPIRTTTKCYDIVVSDQLRHIVHKKIIAGSVVNWLKDVCLMKKKITKGEHKFKIDGRTLLLKLKTIIQI